MGFLDHFRRADGKALAERENAANLLFALFCGVRCETVVVADVVAVAGELLVTV